MKNNPFQNAPVAAPITAPRRPRRPQCFSCDSIIRRRVITIKGSSRKYCLGCEGAARKYAAKLLKETPPQVRAELEGQAFQQMLDRKEQHPMAQAEDGGVFTDSNGYGDS